MKKTKRKQVKTRVGRSKPGSGLGLFAMEPIKKGDFVIEYKGERISTEEADSRGTKYLFEIDDKWTIDGSDRKLANNSRYFNHSCKPNCEAEINEDDVVSFFALRNIREGGELTFDYGKEYFDEFIKPYGCKCDGCKKG